MKISIFFTRVFPLIFMTGVFSTSWAADSCVIKNGMSKELSTYIQTIEKLRGRLETESAKSTCGSNGQESASAKTQNTTSAIVGAMNESIGFSNFYTSGRFYVDLSLKGEIPAGITRDHELLGREIENIKSTMELVYDRCAENTVSSTNLSEDAQYDTTGKTLGTILKEVLQNQVEMMNFYRQTVLGDTTTGQKFILVGKSTDFITQLQSHYGPTAFGLCNGNSDFFAGVQKSFGRIGQMGDGIEKGMSEWEQANALLNSNTTSREYAETEQNVLRAELGRQGVSTKASQASLNCLAQYNSTGIRCGIVNGLSDVVKTMNENKNTIVDQFEKTYDTLKDMLTKPQTTDKYMETIQAINALKIGINSDIVADYTNAKNLIGPENLSADETVGSLIDTHILLESTNTQMKSYIKISEQTCNAQSKGEGNCTFR